MENNNNEVKNTETYKFYPDEKDANFKEIKDDVIRWLVKRLGSKDKFIESKLSKMPFKEIFDLFYNEQKLAIMEKLPDEHLASANEFYNKCKTNPKGLKAFASKFHDVHRFFPEKVFRLVTILSRHPFSLYYRANETQKEIFELLKEYDRHCGNLIFAVNYHENVVSYLLEKNGYCPLDEHDFYSEGNAEYRNSLYIQNTAKEVINDDNINHFQYPPHLTKTGLRILYMDLETLLHDQLRGILHGEEDNLILDEKVFAEKINEKLVKLSNEIAKFDPALVRDYLYDFGLNRALSHRNFDRPYIELDYILRAYIYESFNLDSSHEKTERKNLAELFEILTNS